MVNEHGDAPAGRPALWPFLAAMPAALIALLLLLQVILNVGISFRWPHVSLVNTLFLSVGAVPLSILAAIGVMRTGRPQLAWLGAGILALGAAILLANWVGMPISRDAGVKIQNLGALLAGAIHFAGVIAGELSPQLEPPSMRRRAGTVALTYCGALGAVLLITVISATGILPVFFIPGQGGTALRDMLLTLAAGLFAASALLLLLASRRSHSPFLYVYGMAVALFAVGQLAYVYSATGVDAMSWLGRIGQWSGAVYFLLACLIVVKKSQSSLAGPGEVLETLFPASAEGYKLLIQSSPDAVLGVDAQGRIVDAQGRILIWNRAAQELFGHAGQEPVGKPLDELTGILLHDFTGPGFGAPAGKAHMELRLKGSQGSFWADVSVAQGGNLRSLLRAVIIRDITKRKNAEQALRESEQRWSTTLASIGDAVIAADQRGRVAFMNGIAEALTGWTMPDAANRPVSEVFRMVDEKTRQAVEDPVARVLKTNAVVGLGNQAILLRKNGAEVPIDDSAAPIIGRDGATMGVVLVFRDVTERRKAERVKDEFIGMVSHELRSPLAAVKGGIQAAMYEGLSPDDLRSFLEAAASGADSLVGILDNLLELSRSQADRLLLDVKPLRLQEAIGVVAVQLGSKSAIHRLEIDAGEPLPPVRADRVRVERVLHNLIENAIKYSPRGGLVRVFAQQTDGDSLVIGVSDQGMGISPEEQARLFQPFERLDKSAQRGIKGLGLGLSVCRRLVEAHQGRIWVESQPGKGSTFFFTLPTVRPVAADGQRFRPASE